MEQNHASKDVSKPIVIYNSNSDEVFNFKHSIINNESEVEAFNEMSLLLKGISEDENVSLLEKKEKGEILKQEGIGLASENNEEVNLKFENSFDLEFVNELKFRLNTLSVQVFGEAPEEYEESISDMSSIQRLSQIREDGESIISDSELLKRNHNENNTSATKLNKINNKKINNNATLKHDFSKHVQLLRIDDTDTKDDETIEEQINGEKSEKQKKGNESIKSISTEALKQTNQPEKNFMHDELNELKFEDSNINPEQNKNISSDSRIFEDRSELISEMSDKNYYYNGVQNSLKSNYVKMNDSSLRNNTQTDDSNLKTFEKYKINVENSDYERLNIRRLIEAKEKKIVKKSFDIVKEEMITLNQMSNNINNNPVGLKREDEFKLKRGEVSVIDVKSKLNKLKYLKSIENFEDSGDYVEINIDEINDDYNELDIKNNQLNKSTLKIALPKLSSDKIKNKKLTKSKMRNLKLSSLTTSETESHFNSASESRMMIVNKRIKTSQTTNRIKKVNEIILLIM